MTRQRTGGTGRFLFAAVLVLLNVACSTTPPMQLNRTALRQSQPRSISGRFVKGPRFTISTATVGFAFGLIGGAIENSIDDAKLKGQRVRDPAQAMADQLLEDLATRFSLTIVHAGEHAPRADLVLRLATTQWALSKAKLGGVGVSYEGTLTLLDARTNAILVQGGCVLQPVDGTSVDALSQRGPTALQEEVDGVADACLDDYRHRLLGL